MVKTILSVIISALLIAGAATAENFFVNNQFDRLETALTALEEKVRDGDAVRTDADAVKMLWDSEKKKLHTGIPDNDIS